jgi:hypothetical protein
MTRARELADLLTGGQTITTADNTEQLIFKSTDADASAGPLIKMHRDSSSPADGDNLGRFNFIGENDASEEVTYARIHAKAGDVTDGTEDGQLLFLTTVDGTNRSRMAIGPSETVFNEDSIDSDFRVESDGNANMLFVDAGNNSVGIGTNTPETFIDQVSGSIDVGLAIAGSFPSLVLNDTDVSGDDGTLGITKAGEDTVINNLGAGNVRISNNGAERMRVDSSGKVLIGQTSYSNTSNVSGAQLAPDSPNVFGVNNDLVMLVNRRGNDGNLISFQQDKSEEGSISVSGTTVSYNGGHLSRWSQATDGNRIDSLVKGTVMTNLDQMAKWHHEAQAATLYEDGDEIPEGKKVGDEKTPAIAAYDEDNEQLNCMAVSSVEGDSNVAGVFVNWDDDDKDFTADMNVAMTGDMVIRIAKDTTVARGDLLMSAGDGTAKPQDDDIVRSKTIAKVTSTTKSHTYDDDSYLVPCVLMAC